MWYWWVKRLGYRIYEIYMHIEFKAYSTKIFLEEIRMILLEEIRIEKLHLIFTDLFPTKLFQNPEHLYLSLLSAAADICCHHFMNKQWTNKQRKCNKWT